MQTWRLIIEYDGREFCGWQRQPGVRTVQQVLEEVVCQVLGGEKVSLHASGRTDSGVHALGQVVSFRAEAHREPDRMRLALNTLLPPDVACIDAAHMPEGFHARLSARGKIYRYIVLNRRDRSPFHNGRALYLRRAVDWSAIDAALSDYLGTHDFSSFRGPACTERNPVRTIKRAERKHIGRDEHWLEFEGPGFLRHQIRIMVGTLLEIGEGRRPVDDIPRLYEARSREAAGRTAAPDGLYLVQVFYGPEWTQPEAE